MGKIAAVFGGGKRDTVSKEYQETILIGNILATNGYKVKTGGYYGIMEAISKGVSESGGFVTGHTCKTFATTKGNDYLSETIPAEDIYDRLRLLIEGTDLFIAQRGGLGTLSEVFLVLDCVRKLKVKPRVILVGEFWNHIMISTTPLLNPGEKELYTIVEHYSQIEKYL